ncbi:MAG TPA: zinc-binding alcohol dehydrogenase [Candidatus Latescibacteria bacterium]|nr:zinc-binding alcohol dehydrogenase [Candidatus Latescibacterota bacterium]
MKTAQVVFTGCCRAELVEHPAREEALEAHEVIGTTLATIISAGTELAVYQGLAGGTYPAHPGYAAVFRIDAVGSEVKGFRPGDVAFCMGPHRSFQRTKEEFVVRVPSEVPPEQAVFARMMAVSMSTLTTTAARPPAAVLVTGLGLVGHLAAQIFASCGYDVTAVDPLEVRRTIASDSGIARVFASVPPEIAGSVSLAVECSGNERAVLDACGVVRKGGEVVLVGVPWKKRTDLAAFDLLHAVFHRYVVLRSGWEWEVPLLPTDFRQNSIYGNIAAAMRWIAEGRVRVEHLFRVESPRRATEAFSALASGSCDRLGIVFDWTNL